MTFLIVDVFIFLIFLIFTLKLVVKR